MKSNNKYNSGQKLWNKAKKIIPGGNMLISKRPQKFLPKQWPTYFSKAKGCEIWDLDGNKYYDLSLMGVGTNILGYGNRNVDKAVLDTVKKGNMSTLNCPEEVELTEKLLKIHKWAGLAKYARSGGEINTVAIRIARAFSRKQKIAICGYHGWHDWYLAANLRNKKNLDSHLSSEVNIQGVSKSLKNSIVTFNYNDFDGLKKIVKKNKIGIIKMEVQRNIKPQKNFLKKVRKLANNNNIVLIFDECTSGFRETYGGLHLKYKVYPDILLLGKALGNGYAITAMLAKKKFLKVSNSLFISSTFWTERIGFKAAIATLNEMKKKKSWKRISLIGKFIKKNWFLLARKNNLHIEIEGLDALCNFTIKSYNFNKYKTYITQEMLKKRILATTTIYVSIKHNLKILKKYFNELDKIFYKIHQFEKNKNIKKNLKFGESEKVFRQKY